MKIAVCIFGQPRFYKDTSESFRQEFFDFPGHDVDVFMHCWTDVGNTPDDEWSGSNKKNEIQSLKDDVWNNYKNKKSGSHFSLKVEDPEETFGPICDSLAHVLQTLRHDKWLDDTQEDWAKHLSKIPINTVHGDSDKTSIRIANGRVLRYEMGQLYSLGKAVELKSWHEKENDFKYDVVIKVRTDAVFKPKELYDDKEDYYKDKEDYYFQGVRNNKRGVFGCGLTLIIGAGNGTRVAGGKAEIGMVAGMTSIEVEDGKITEIESREGEEAGEIIPLDYYKEVLLDDTGTFNFPFKVHHKDWLMFADSDSADLAWSTMISTYISLLARDISRFTGRKQLPYMPGGEVIHAGAALFNDVNLYQSRGSTQLDDKKRGRWLKEIRVFKVVHPDVDKRKEPFKATDPETQLRLGYIAADTSKNMLNSLLKLTSPITE